MGENSSGLPLPERLRVDENSLEENWKKWRQLWRAYVTASQLHKQDKDAQVGTLMLALGPDALNLLNTLPYASDADKEDPENILELLDQRCIGKKNIIYERYRFRSRKQYEGESFETFLTAPCTLASTYDLQTFERTE